MAALPKLKTNDDTLSTRQNILAHGYLPIPCKGKYPADFKGWQECRATADNLLAWEETHPENRNTGILTGEVVAIDVDILRPELTEAIVNMVRELPGGASAPMRVGKAPKALFLFRTDGPREKSATDWFKIDGIDQRIEIMGTGQQVIVDGIHPETGRPYEWHPAEASPAHLPVADLPLLDWPSLERMLADASALLAEHAEERKAAPKPRVANNDNLADNFFRRVNQAALDDLGSWVPALDLPKTKRHGEGYRAVCAWRGVKNANLSFHPGGITDWGSGETHTAIDVAVNAGRGDGVASAAEWLCGQLGKAKEDLGWIDKGAPMMPPPEAIAKLVAKKSKPADLDPFTPESIGGLGGMVAEWILSTSRRKSPELAVMSAIAFLAAFYGRRVATPTGCGVNLYLAGIAGPGFGKEAPLARLVNLLQSSGMAYLIGPGEVTSAGAIEKVLRKKPVMVMPWDEVGDVLESMNVGSAGTGNWAATIRKAMLELYSKSTGVWFGKERVDEDKNSDPIHCPTMSVVGTSTPIRFYGGLTEGNLKDGFVARWIFIAPKARPSRANPTDNGLRLPAALSEAVSDAQGRFPWPVGKLMGGAAGWRSASVTPSLIEVPWADAAAEKDWLAVEDWQEGEIIRDESRDGIIGRFAENAIRLATLRALSRDPASAAVAAEDVAWARCVMDASIEAIESGVDKHMVSSKFETLCKSILTALRSAKDGQIFRAEMLRRRGVRGADGRTFDDALKRLQETGEIERSDGKTYRLAAAA